ncbi:beta family protein [Halomonas saccharevitans]|uniref:Beta protein n=1 Tax=Halomonas saccharevitans TaxID=416872 RepID=A0A1I7CYN4_9GAMM|nr:beta family protein [Halomonas saccharevitans]SFU04542.1 Beta protein [Halomonas saccharevitans]
MDNPFLYMPVTKWRQGEYQALLRLHEPVKDHVLPLIVVPPVEYDFEERRPKKTVQEHIQPFAKRFIKKWGGRKACIDLHESLVSARMQNASFVVSYIFEELRQEGCAAIPVIRLSHDVSFLSEVKYIVSVDGKGVALRISLDDIMSPNIDSLVKSVMSRLDVDISNVDLIIDIEQPESFQPYDVFSKALSSAIRNISDLVAFRTFFVAGTSLKLSNVQRPGGEPTRHEWLFYKELARELKDIRVPDYGDYTIETPDFIDQDMRFLKPAGKIVYTTDSTWLVPKGKNFREDNGQMVGHCSYIVSSGKYCGPKFSHGDKRIYNTLHKIEGTGNQGTWKGVGVNHHITFVIKQLSTFRVY